jgi:hypothetical protein
VASLSDLDEGLMGVDWLKSGSAISIELRSWSGLFGIQQGEYQGFRVGVYIKYAQERLKDSKNKKNFRPTETSHFGERNQPVSKSPDKNHILRDLCRCRLKGTFIV